MVVRDETSSSTVARPEISLDHALVAHHLRAGKPCAKTLPRSSTTARSTSGITTSITCSTMTMVTPRSADSADELDALARFGRRQPRERLVEQQKFRLRRERARDLEPPLLGRGELDGRRLGAREEPGELEHLRAPCAAPRARPRGASRRRRRRSRRPTSNRSCAPPGRCARCRARSGRARSLVISSPSKKMRPAVGG